MKRKSQAVKVTSQDVSGIKVTPQSVPDTMKCPPEVHIKTSAVDTAKLGVWCKKPLKQGQKFGPFAGKITRVVTDGMDASYVWEITDQKTNKFLFYIDASDTRRANWLRYVNCARNFKEQNLVSEQEGTDIFFTTIRDVSVGEELLSWFTPPDLNKKRNNSKLVEDEAKVHEQQNGVRREKNSPVKSLKTGSMKDKVNVNGKSTKKAATNTAIKSPSAVVRDETSEQRVTAKGTVKSAAARQALSKAVSSVNCAQAKTASSASHVNIRKAKTDHKFKLGSSGSGTKNKTTNLNTKVELKSKTTCSSSKNSSTSIARKRSAQILETFPVKKRKLFQASDKKDNTAIGSERQKTVPYKDDDSVSNSADSNSSVNSECSSSSKFFQFVLLPDNIMPVSSGSKLYRCHVCFGVYRHIFSLKRHFIREHVNAKYISPADSHNCIKSAANSKQSDDESDEDVALEDSAKLNGKNAPNKSGKNASSIRVTVSVSSTGKVSDRKVENGSIESSTDGKKGKSKKTTSNLKSKKSEESVKTIANNVSKSNGCGKKASDDDDRDMFKCNLCALTFSSCSSLSGHLKLHLCSDDIDMSSSGSELSPVAYTGSVKKEAGKVAPPEADLSADEDGSDDVDSRKRLAVAAETQHNDKRKFVCDRCGAGFTVRYSMNRHKLRKSCKANGSEKNILDRQRAAFTFMKKSHNKLPIKNTLAAAVVKATVPVAATVAVRKRAKCRYCQESFGGGRQLRVHRRTKHPEHYFECTSCTAYFHDQQQLDTHLQLVHHKAPPRKSDKKSAQSSAGLAGGNAVMTPLSVKTTMTVNDKSKASSVTRNGDSTAPLLLATSTLVCTTCDRRFLTYAKYAAHCELFHRRQMAADGSRKTLLAKLSQLRDTDTPTNLDLSAEVEINHNERFYAIVARKIRDNLNNFVSGKATELNANVDTGKKPRRGHGAVKSTKDVGASLSAKSTQPAVDWSIYNLPADFVPYDADKLLLFARSSLSSETFIVSTNSSETVTKQPLGDGLAESNSHDKATTAAAAVSPIATVTGISGTNNGIDAIYSCSKCRRTFGTFVMYQEHTRIRHGMSVERTRELLDSLVNPNSSDSTNMTSAANRAVVDYSGASALQHDFVEKHAASSEDDLFSALHLRRCSKLPKGKGSGHTTSIEPLTVSVTHGESTGGVARSEASSPQLTVRPHRQLHSPGHALTPALSPVWGQGQGDVSTVVKGTVVSQPPSLLKHRARFMCRVCHMVLASVDNVEKHEAENHPMIECSFVDVSDENRPSSFKWSRDFLGSLQVASSVLPPSTAVADGQSKKCTKCNATVSDLHQHVMHCADPEPLRYYYMYALPAYARRQSTNGKFQKRRVLCRSLVMSRATSMSNFDLGRLGSSEAKAKDKLQRDPGRLPYNLRNQLQASETQLSTTSELKCDGCGVWYDTISSLERHIPICAEKEKIREKANLERQSSVDDDIEYDPSKFMCIYCVRQFTYLRLLVRHLAESCPVRKRLVNANEYIDKEWEADTLDQFNKFKSAREALQSRAAMEENAVGEAEQLVKVVRKRGVWWGSRRRIVTPTKRADNALAASLLDDNSSCSSFSSASQTPDKFYNGNHRAAFATGGENVEEKRNSNSDRKMAAAKSESPRRETVDSHATNEDTSSKRQRNASMNTPNSTNGNSHQTRLKSSPNKSAMQENNRFAGEVKRNGFSPGKVCSTSSSSSRKRKSERSRSCDDEDDSSRSLKVTAKRRLSMETVSQVTDSGSPSKRSRCSTLSNGCNSSLMPHNLKLNNAQKHASNAREAQTTGGRR